jgi:hypothetical protein
MGGQIGVRAVSLSAALAVTTLLVLGALGWQPAVGSAEVITSSGPLGTINVENGLDCQVQVSGDIATSFFGGPEDGGCGTFLALTAGEDVPESDTIFGPSPAAGITTEAAFTPVAQTLTGEGTASKPFVVITRVYAEEPVPDSEEKAKVAELIETDSYVTGQDSYETTIVAKNLQTEALTGTIYHVGDCYLADHDTGFGALNVPVAGSVACTVTPNDIPSERIMAFTPIETGGFPVSSAHYVESKWPSFWEDIKPNGEQLPDSVDFTGFENEAEDNGMGLSWPIKLAASNSKLASEHEATLKLATTVTPYGAPASSTTAGSCVPSGQVPITVTAPNGAKAVDYVLDGAAGSAATNAAGQATITLTPGQHTLEYWAEDQAGAQETPHHVLNVTVASGGPALTIASEQGKSSYLAGETGSVAITATGPGLTSNPSATKVALATSTPGSFSVARTAADACGATSASFNYTVTRNTLATLPPPVLGKTVNVEPVSGEVFVKYPPGYASASDASLADPLEAPAQLDFATESVSKGIGFIPLREARQIPVDSVLETTGGEARIATATSKPKEQQFGNFGGGIFKLLQNRKQKGLTDLNIINNHSASQVCASVGKKGKGKAYAAKLSSKTLGRVNANGHGHFTVQGQYSAATVRGTVWNVGNRCEGTFTHVTRGVVSVRDFSRRKTITLFTGQSYTAKAPRRR